MRAASLLATVAGIHPQAWDAIIPHGPRMHISTDLASLNPQPLPPQGVVQIAAAAMAQEVVRIAMESDVRGDSAAGFLKEWVDDWCGTPWPRKWPWPWPGPRQGEGPHPEPWAVDTGRIVGAVVLASAGSRLADGELRLVFLDGAERLAAAAVPE